MIVACSRHGKRIGCKVSPDLWAAPGSAPVATEYIEFSYEFLGDATFHFYRLSAKFAQKHGIVPGTYPLPDVYPPWVDEITGMCQDCFLERYKNSTVRR
jgi:hypothetical protein